LDGYVFSVALDHLVTFECDQLCTHWDNVALFSLAECVRMVVSDAGPNAFHGIFVWRLASTRAAILKPGARGYRDGLRFRYSSSSPFGPSNHIFNAKRDDGDIIDRSAFISTGVAA
jgi:hypothetical protein